MPTDWAETVGPHFAAAGYARVEPPVLQPADVFLDLSGEEIRSRMFVTTDAEGREWALRPEYTIPVARLFLAQGSASPAAFSYSGPVFRIRPGETGEFIQAGIESYGRTDLEAADAEVLGLAIEAVAAAGLTDPEIRLGDAGLFTALLEALACPPAAARTIRRAFAQGRLTPELLASLGATAAPQASHSGLLRALQGQEPKAAQGFVEDLLRIAGISSVGGRSAGEIAERFLAQAANGDASLSAETQAILARFTAIAGDPDSASLAVRALAKDAGLPLDAALDAFDTRTGFMAARGIDVAQIAFSAGFGRNLDYYTGVVFELRDPRRPELRPIVGGGRYDGLLSRLGAAAPIPAVGCSIWLGRLPGATS